ncbi:MAG: hypothetical protein ACE5Z5_06040 [Candidatus Bathyarchaeia archaeon]
MRSLPKFVGVLRVVEFDVVMRRVEEVSGLIFGDLFKYGCSLNPVCSTVGVAFTHPFYLMSWKNS